MNSAQMEGSRPSQQTEGSRPDEHASGGSPTPKGKGLRHKTSFTFMQSLFRRASKTERESSQKREADIREERGDGV